jgi:Zn-dependent M28 family amino/carboxypeptidase
VVPITSIVAVVNGDMIGRNNPDTASLLGSQPPHRNSAALVRMAIDANARVSHFAIDSIWNGADDNASTSVAMLAIARAWKQHPGRRSALFVWHGAEEKGLLGSKYHAAHPVVPITSIAAVVNGDMIGRNHPDTASLLGSQPPHRNSAALVRMAIDANTRVSHFGIDSLWDRPAHPEGFYFRSDHTGYAARNVPSLFFTTVLHDIYHTPFDEPSRIEYAKLTRMAKWMYATGWAVSETRERPAIDPGYKFSR